MAIRCFFLGSLAALSVPVTLLEPSWLGPIKALAAVDIRDKDNRPHNVLPSFSPSLLARRRGTFAETYDKVGAHSSILVDEI